MSTDQSESPVAQEQSASPRHTEKRGWGGWIAGAALAAFALFFIANCRVALDPRVANPNVQGRPRPVRFIFGLDYITFLHISTVIMLLVLLAVFVRGWRRNPGSPVMLMFLCTTLIVWQDPIMNWAPFAVYNPDLIHWPESWPLVSLSPTVEPFVVFGYVTFYFGPYFPAIWILRKLQAKYGPTAFVSRHPLISLGLLTCVIGFVFDAWLEIQLVHMGMYIYSQVIPWGSVFTGTTFQFPLIWESFSVTFVMVPAAILCYRDDTGKSVAEKLAAKAKIFPTRPVLGTFLVMFAIINVSYFAYGAWFWIIKVSHAATSVACPWPYPEAKVYDPQGYYEKAGAQGPYSVGIWSTWASGEPNGRPHVDPRRRAWAPAQPRARMAEPRSVVLTGASRGLGFASAVRLYREGWRVVAAMRTPDGGLPLLREATGAHQDDDRLVGVQLDLLDPASISAAAKAIEEAVGAPYAVVHNAGISAAGMVEETDMALWQRMFQTTVMGPVALTQALLPSMRAAGGGASSWFPARPACAASRPPRRTRRPRARWSGGVRPWRARSRPSVWVSPCWWRARTTPRSSPTRAPPTIATSAARTPGCTTR